MVWYEGEVDPAGHARDVPAADRGGLVAGAIIIRAMYDYDYYNYSYD